MVLEASACARRSTGVNPPGRARTGAAGCFHQGRWIASRGIVVIALPPSPPPALPPLLPEPVGAAGRLAWAPCRDPAQQGYECATLPVPIDHAARRGATLDLALIRARAREPARRIGVLVLDAGAAFGPGSRALPSLAAGLPAAVRARFDLIAWDRRGSGASSPVSCFATPAEAAAFRASRPAGFPVDDGQARRWSDAYDRLARLCGERHGALLSHLSSADSARDLELLRRALGESRLNLRGSGEGSLVGATYANLYPAQLRAMVLDGSLDPVGWFNGGHGTSSLTTGLRQQQDEAAASTLQALLRRCGQAGPARCSFAASGPGGGVAATQAKFGALMQRLLRKPARWQGQPLTYAAVLAGLAARLAVVDAGGTGGWVAAARFLEGLQRGGGGGSGGGSGGGGGSAAALGPAAGESAETQLALRCAETPNPRAIETYRQLASFAYGRAGVVGPATPWSDFPCSRWPARAAAAYRGPWNRPTALPVLVIGTRYDPITPYSGALEMGRELGNARRLSVNGYGHTVLRNPSACASLLESAYWIGGSVPAEGTVCRPDREPFDAGP